MDNPTDRETTYDEAINLASYGFAPALVVAIGFNGASEVLWRDPALLRETGVSYAALRDDGVPLVTGAARGTLWHRWQGILGVISGEGCWRLGPMEDIADPRRWASTVRGRQFQVWARKSLDRDGVSLAETDAAALAAVLRPNLGSETPEVPAANHIRRPKEHVAGS